MAANKSRSTQLTTLALLPPVMTSNNDRFTLNVGKQVSSTGCETDLAVVEQVNIWAAALEQR